MNLRYRNLYTLVLCILGGAILATSAFARPVTSAPLPSQTTTTRAVGPTSGPRQGDAASPLVSPPAARSNWRKYLLPIGSNLVVNGIFWTGARFGLNADYARISVDTVKANFRKGFVWDSDHFDTNQFGHPYQGGLYHSGARAAGLSFWQAFPYGFLGSLQWELFMESEYPAANDLITTTFGGLGLGEALFQLSHLVLDDATTGRERFFREFGAALINPMVGIERLLSGKSFALGRPSKRRPLRVHLSIGADRINAAESVGSGGAMPSVQFRGGVQVGELGGSGKHFQPFDYFTLNAGINLNRRINAAEMLDLTAPLVLKRVACGAPHRCYVAVVQHFDFYSASIFKVGSSSLGPGLYTRIALPGGFKLDAEGAVLGVLLGAFDSPYVIGVERDYNLGQGLNTRLELRLRKPGIMTLRMMTAQYWIATVGDSNGHEFANIARVSGLFPITAGFGIELGAGVFGRSSVFESRPTVNRKVTLFQVHLHWNWQRNTRAANPKTANLTQFAARSPKR